MDYTVRAIGFVRQGQEGTRVELDAACARALRGLEGFSHVDVLWWFSRCDGEADRKELEVLSPYRLAPEKLGAFATRSPCRPNPVALSVAGVTFIDVERGVLGLDWLDAEDGTPVLDLKPYTPSADRVEAPRVPEWCAHWPGSYECSGDFDWAGEFRF